MNSTPPKVPTPQIDIDLSDCRTDYANFCRLAGAPEEVLFDFGLIHQADLAADQSIVNSHRIVTSWHTAKRLLQIVSMSVERHEAAFGVLETDVQLRL